MSNYYPTNDASCISNIQELACNNAYEDARDIIEPLVGEEIEKRANENVDDILVPDYGHPITDDPKDFREYYVSEYISTYPQEVEARQQKKEE